MADIAKRAGKEDARSHRGRGADIGKRAGSRADENGRRHRRRNHKSAAPSLEVAAATPSSTAAPSSPVTATPKPDSIAAKPASTAKTTSIAKPIPAVRVAPPPQPPPAPTAPAPAPTAPAPAPTPAPASAPTAPAAKTTAAPTAPKSTVVKDPATLDLAHLFNNPAMFESRDTWQAAGFIIIAGKSAGEILVASHPSVPGILFKKFTAEKSADDQLRNYQTRVEGARRLRSFIAANRLEGIAVPRKWIQQLPGPNVAHILVEDYLDVLSRRDTQEAYNGIDSKTLHDLCVVVRAFPGLDSGARNMLITKDKKIAFIDTERWDQKRDRDRPGLRHIRDYLSDKQRKTMQKIFQQLDSSF